LIRAKGLLFDIDGTLVQSLAAVERSWMLFAERHGLDTSDILHKIHGRRSIDSIRLILPHVDAAEQDLILRQIEVANSADVLATEGALQFLECIVDLPWAVVTSGTSDVATARLQAAGITGFAAAVFGEDVVHGKPDPEPYRLGADRLGFDPAECVAFEDTAAGIRSAKAAGMKVIGIGDKSELGEADMAVRDFTQISCYVDNGEAVLQSP
jgi:sugar-phosphatase